jgi:hypothetical protein
VLTALPDPSPGTLRRTLSVEVTPDPDWDAGLRITATARDAVIQAPDNSKVLRVARMTVTLRVARMTVTLDGRSRVTGIEGDLAPAAAGRLLGAGATRGFRDRLAGLDELDPSSLESALLDELPTVRLISGYARLIEMTGAATREISGAVRERLRGTRSRTHLNDTLRFLRYVPALAAALPRAADADATAREGDAGGP